MQKKIHKYNCNEDDFLVVDNNEIKTYYIFAGKNYVKITTCAAPTGMKEN